MDYRPYQKESILYTLNEWKAHKSTLLVLPTGTGKTIIMSGLIKIIVNSNKKVLLLAHREELLLQAQDKLYKSTGITSELEKANYHANKDSSVVIGSVQTLSKENRLMEYEKDHFDFILIDECHHAITNTYKRVLDYFDNAKILGVTATPKRSDLRDLSEIFETVAYQYDIKTAINDGFLCDINIRTLPLTIDLRNVDITCGDYRADELGETIEPYLEQIADMLIEYAPDRKTLIFVPRISTGDKMVEILKEKGISAANVSSLSKDRKELLEQFSNGQIQVMTNSMLLTEGYDEPSVDCIINLRATRSMSLYTQILGRGLRLAENKENLLVLDFLWQSKKDGYDILSPVEVFLDDDMIKYAHDILKDNEEISLNELETEVNRKIDAELALLEELKRASHRHFKNVEFKELDNPNIKYRYDSLDNLDCYKILASPSIEFYDKDLLSFYPYREWEVEPITEGQRDYLYSCGINVNDIQFKGHASKIITTIKKRKDKGLCSYKQYKFLTKKGFIQVEKWNVNEAKRMIDKIANNNWRIPRGTKTKNYIPQGI